LFTQNDICLDSLRRKAYNLRWAEVEEGVIPLTAADSDFPPAPEIGRAMKQYIDEGYFPYAPKLGMPELRKALEKSLWERKGERVKADCILPIDSAARGMFVIAKAVLRAGDEVIVFDPVDFLFRESALAAGASPVYYPSVIKNGQLDLSRIEAFITPRTRMIGLCNPHNPLGVTYPPEDLDYLLEVAARHDLWIMNDEVWSDIIHADGVFTSIMARENTQKVLSVFGFSKSFGIAGLRAGCIYCTDETVFEKLTEASDVTNTAGGVSILSQVAALACVEQCYYWVDAFCEHLTANRDYALARLRAMPFVRCHTPKATFVLFCDISEAGMKSEDLCAFLLKEHKVAAVPGGERYFGPASEGFIRISIATSREILTEGLDRIERGLLQLRRRAGH
jgi:cystathionine beta-lyase